MDAQAHTQKAYGFVKNLHLIEQAYFDKRLQEQTKLTLALMVRYADQDGCIEWFSIKATSDRKGVSRRAVQNQINNLIRFGYLRRIENKGKDWRNKYTLLFDHHVTPLGDTHVTQLGHTHDTPLDHSPCDRIKSHNENSEIKKEKNALTRDEFLDQVKEKIKVHGFQVIGNLSEELINKEALACWHYWEANLKHPKGDYIAGFHGWLSMGLKNKKFKEASKSITNSNSSDKKQPNSPTNPLQNWHKDISLIVDADTYNTWLRNCWHDGNGSLYAPTKFKAQWIHKHYNDQIAQVLPNVAIKHRAYNGELDEQPL